MEPNPSYLHEQQTVELELNTENMILSLSPEELDALRQPLLKEKPNEEEPPVPHNTININASNSHPQTHDTKQEMNQGSASTINMYTRNIKNTKNTIHNMDTHQSDAKPLSLPTKSPNKIKQIDEALATYYDRVGVRNYFDSNGIGRFSAFIEREAFDVDALSIEEELGTRSNADNTMYTEFDAQFPLIGIADCDIDKDTIIFYILQFCYLHNEPPTIDEVTNEFALTRIHNTRDTTKLAQMDDALGRYYTRLGVDDYFDSNGIGKLSGFIERESFDVDLGSIRNEIGPSSTISNTMYTEFDPHFPLNGVLLPLLSRYNVDKDDIVFYVLQFCFKYNDPPTYSQIRTQIGNIAIRHTFSSMIQGHTKIQQMDEALAKYYHSLGINGYVDSNDMGKLAAFIEQNAMDNHIMAIEQEIGAHANPHISRYIQFDPQFPFHDDVWRLMADHDIHKDYFIFFVLQFCYVFHDAPTNSDIKQEAERLSHKDSTTMQDLTQAPPIYLSSILNDRAVRSTPQPISKVYGDVDLCIFAKRDESIPTCDPNSADPMEGCVALNRLVVALMYYSRLDIFNNKKDQDMFAAFVSDVYSHCLDDYTHLLSKHKDVKAISNAVNAKKVLPSCDVTTCPSILGHPRQDTNSQLSMDNRTQFYVQIMDSVHCSIVHLLESDAISPRRNGGRQIERLSRRLDSNTTSFDRFKSGAKFAIIDDTWSHQDRTYMDEFYNHVVNQVNVTPSQADELEMFLNTHAYDSDVLKWDMKQEHSSFIAKYLKTNNCIQSAIVFVDREAISSSSYRLGFRFYYWPYYETLETMSISNEWFNSNELCPCPPREMYV
eukprot:42756_1